MLKKYVVYLTQEVVSTTIVEANSEEEAIEIAQDEDTWDELDAASVDILARLFIEGEE